MERTYLFLFFQENIKIDYSPGRIIVFDSKLEHKAMPITPYAKSDRFTLAIKLSIIDESL